MFEFILLKNIAFDRNARDFQIEPNGLEIQQYSQSTHTHRPDTANLVRMNSELLGIHLNEQFRHYNLASFFLFFLHWFAHDTIPYFHIKWKRVYCGCGRVTWAECERYEKLKSLCSAKKVTITQRDSSAYQFCGCIHCSCYNSPYFYYIFLFRQSFVYWKTLCESKVFTTRENWKWKMRNVFIMPCTVSRKRAKRGERKKNGKHFWSHTVNYALSFGI